MIQQALDNYPFSAIVGHEKLKMALLLATVDPKIGGVLISGPRGTAKTTAARALAALLPDHGRFLTLPLGASEDRLLGSINIERVLKDGKVDFSPGLLHAAHNGILYVDEINLLADHLVDLLLDVAASGVNFVERDGITHQHAAKILLIGTMNPDEGELRPQLTDRFGFFIDLPAGGVTAQKVEIIKRRLAFDDNPQAFIQRYNDHEKALKSKCLKTRNSLGKVQWDEELYTYICDLTAQACAEGLRADLVIMRAARAYAAWQNKTTVSVEDIDYVAPWALAHRHKHASKNSAPMREIMEHAPPRPNHSEFEPDWGELPPQSVSTGPFRLLPDEEKKKSPN